MANGAEIEGRRRQRLDLRGLKCPLPALHTRRALGRLAPGAVLVVLCNDPLAGVDIPHLVAEVGDALVDASRDGDGWRFVVRRCRTPGREDPTAPSPRWPTDATAKRDDSETDGLRDPHLGNDGTDGRLRPAT